jgi:hypothetical protein
MVKRGVTRTVNPLHFEDLEPHRFEDLVRQIAYDYRVWQSLEATGRLGSDEGIDIRATEQPLLDAEGEPELADPDQEPPNTTDEAKHGSLGTRQSGARVWTIQCKRERSIGPAQVSAIVRESIRPGPPPPYGFILAAACNFSVKAREVFRTALREKGIQEHALWGKAELEDMLFQPKYRNGRIREGPPLSECERVEHPPKEVPEVTQGEFEAGIRAE